MCIWARQQAYAQIYNDKGEQWFCVKMANKIQISCKESVP
jgi:hypothetical protein